MHCYVRFFKLKIMYVIKNRFGEYVNRNESDGKKLDYFADSDGIEVAEHYTESEIEMIKERFKGTWREDGFKVFEIVMSLKAVE